MSTLQSIGITLATGSAVGLASLAAFGVALRRRSTLLAPRAAARPPAVIYEPRRPNQAKTAKAATSATTTASGKRRRQRSSRRHNNDDDPDDDPSPYRGNPWCGWVPWAMGLSYAQLLAGVPGTGTRRGGRAGSFLRLNLDAVVLLRFHALCRRVALLASLLCLGLLLPLYVTANCFHGRSPWAASPDTPCAATNLTDYERTTIANVHAVDRRDWGFGLLLSRLYVTTFSFWILVLYTLYLLSQEWVQILAMRRVYYLEYDVWGERRREIKATLLYDEQDQTHHRRHQQSLEATWTTMRRPARVPEEHDDAMADDSDVVEEGADDENDDDDDDDYLVRREAWIPHPEQRDTVPNVALYSLLVGGLPSLPVESGEGVDTEAAVSFGKRESMDWQLSLTTAFFDHCVPNMPGYSSSVAAVTILPAASKMVGAWRAWYTAASRLRRLRFIRRHVAARRRQLAAQQQDKLLRAKSLEEEPLNVPQEYVDKGRSVMSPDSDVSKPAAGVGFHSFDYADDGFWRDTGMGPATDLERGRAATGSDMTPSSIYTPRPIYDTLDVDSMKKYYRQVIGSAPDDNEGVDFDMYDALFIEPEQLAVYSREFAQAAAPCCPYGCHQERIERASLDELLDLEQDAVEEFQRALERLKEVRRRVAVADVVTDEDERPEKITTSQHEEKIHLSPKPNYQATPDVSREPPLHLSPVLERPATIERPSTIKRDASAPTLSPNRPPIISRGKSVDAERMGSNLRLEAKIYQRSTSFTETPSDGHLQTQRQSQSNRVRIESDADRARKASDAEWAMVMSIINEAASDAKTRAGFRASVATGRWTVPKLLDATWVKDFLNRKFKQVKGWAKIQSVEAIDTLARHSTYAVVTFTSRQAAVAARHCLADGRGVGRWTNLSGMPIPPLADAAACDILACRNCCRPVTVSINDRQKNARRYAAYIMLALIYVFYTIPLAAASQLVSYADVDSLFPGLSDWSTSAFGVTITHLLSGLVSAFIYTAFFSLCPYMFKAISNFGSGATSVAQAEFSALKYYWWFMVLTAFTGQLLANMVIDVFKTGTISNEFASVLKTVAITIPSTLAPTWLNWLIFRVTVTVPLNYLLNINAFLFAFLGWDCCTRAVIGGGPGGTTPYRLYVDTGTALMCCLALGPSSPLVALASLVYFLVMEPLMRRNAIFVYRPKFDAGGARWPFVFEIFISVLIVASILLATQMALKQATGPAILAALPIIPILLFQQSMKEKYLRAFTDAGLLQTSLLDGWDTTEETSLERREEFRRFLVDAHKAAYVPVCISGTDTDHFITAEPAVVTPLPNDADRDDSLPDTSSGDAYALPQLDSGPFTKSRSKEDDEDDEGSPVPIPAPVPLGGAGAGVSQGGGLLRRPPLMEGGSSRRRAYSSSAIGSAYFGPRESLSPSDASSGAFAFGAARGTPKRGTIFTSKSTHRDLSAKMK